MFKTIFIQILVIISYLVYYTGRYSKTKHGMLKTDLFSKAFVVASFVLMGEMAGAYSNIISGARVMYACEKNKKHIPKAINSLVFIIFTVILIVACVVTYKNAWSILPYLSSLVSMWAMWYGTTSQMRIIGVICAITYGGYMAAIANYTGTFFEFITLATNLHSLILYRKIKSKKGEVVIQ